MDIIHRYPLQISLSDNMLFIDDNANYAPSFKGTLAQGLIAIEMLVNKRALRMIVDTGAPIAYIKRTIVAGLAPVREVEDFNPLIGTFKTYTYRCEVNLIIEDLPSLPSYHQEFGILPVRLESILSMLHFDGIIGIDLFKRYRIQIKAGKLFLPPQGI